MYKRQRVTISRHLGGLPGLRETPSFPVSRFQETRAQESFHLIGRMESDTVNRIMVIYITSDHCQYCEAMKRDTWCNETIRERRTSGFVAIRLTPHENARVLDRIKITAYPTTLIGIPQGKIIDQRVGYQPPRSMHQLLSKVKRR